MLEGRIEIETNTGTKIVGTFKEHRTKDSQNYIIVLVDGKEVFINEKVVGVIQPCSWGRDGVWRNRKPISDSC